MVIILTDKTNGKQVKAVGHERDYMIYRKAKGVEVDGKLMTKNGKEFKNEWRFTGLYPSTITAAIWHCMNLLLNDPDSNDVIEINISKIKFNLDELIKKKLDQIVIDTERIYQDGYSDGIDARNEAAK